MWAKIIIIIFFICEKHTWIHVMDFFHMGHGISTYEKFPSWYRRKNNINTLSHTIGYFHLWIKIWTCERTFCDMWTGQFHKWMAFNFTCELNFPPLKYTSSHVNNKNSLVRFFLYMWCRISICGNIINVFSYNNATVPQFFRDITRFNC